MLQLLVELFVRSLRVVRIALVAVLAIIVISVGYVTCLTVNYVKAAAKFDNIKSATLHEVNDLIVRGRQQVSDWLEAGR